MTDLTQKLKDWRSKKGREENLELYIVLHNKTIETIAEVLPKNEKEFKMIKGLGGKKFEKYGKEILAIVREFSGESDQSVRANIDDVSDSEEKIISVSDFLNLVNSNLVKIQAGIKGEISSVNIRGHVYFSLQDKEDGSVINCFMRTNDYQICGIEIEEGLEAIIHGYPEVYKPSGKLSFQSLSIELVGEGALKKAYDDLKKKLLVEGVFDESRKRPLPALPSRIGLITSRDGAVIHDFQSNIGRFGYKVTLYDSRVEGALAVRDLISAVRYFKDKSIDLLVIIRGGGSLESLQAFNNEALIREIVDYPIPVVCGIGHDKDVPLFCYAVDKALSTPTAVAKEINQSWEQAVDKISRYESEILYKYTLKLANQKNKLENYYHRFTNQYHNIVRRITAFDQIIINLVNNIFYGIKNGRNKIYESTSRLVNNFSTTMTDSNVQIGNSIKLLRQNNPNRQLKLGYSIIFSGDKVIKSVNQVEKNDVLRSRLSNGVIVSTINKIIDKE